MNAIDNPVAEGNGSLYAPPSAVVEDVGDGFRSGDEVVHAGFWRRAAALFIDSFAVGIAFYAVIFAAMLVLGIGGTITYPKNLELRNVVSSIPLEKIVLETDAPFLTPSPFRGKICEPKHVRVTAEFLSRLREESLEDVAATTTRNAAQLFNLN